MNALSDFVAMFIILLVITKEKFREKINEKKYLKPSAASLEFWDESARLNFFHRLVEKTSFCKSYSFPYVSLSPDGGT